MKTRFSNLDLLAISTEFQTEIVDLRLQNIYDVSSRFVQFKFAAQDRKVLVLL
jgi:predicted ribosome quality control (RQC) complex YloA/Tae2 family protein